MHFYLKNANKDDIANFMKEKKLSTFGMPIYHGNGSHIFKGEKYRYLVLERYGKDLWSVFISSGRSFPPVTVFQIGLQMLDVLEYIHSRGYVHADIKGANILLGLKKGTENQAYLVDFGLAARVNEKEFKPDPKCAHNGTIEYTSRDAHLGVPTMRGDLEILGYNMLQWIVGELPWEKVLSQPKTVQGMKEAFMKSVRAEIKKYNNVPEQLIKFFEYINSIKPKDPVDYSKCRQMFESYLKTQRKTKTSKLEFGSSKKRTVNKSDEVNPSGESNDESGDETPVKVDDKKKKRAVKQNGDAKPKRSRRRKDENTEPDKNASLIKKRKSVEPSYVVKIKRTKMAPKATPPAKQNHSNIATQTSGEKPKKNSRQVTFDSPICAVIGENKDTSGDIFDDSFVDKDKRVKPKRRLLSDEEVTVKRVVRRKVTSVKAKGKSWKNTPAVLNGRSPPKS